MSNRRKIQTKIQMKEIAKFIKEGLKITAKTKVDKYNYQPKTKRELHNLLNQLIEERGNEGDFNDIDTSKIKDMSELFDNIDNRDKFNGDISNWDVSNVVNMNSMFYKCESFNQPLNNWDVSNVKEMVGMFYKCYRFNYLLNNWDVSNVKSMSYMFYDCISFNQDISNWDVSKVIHTGFMFERCAIDEKYKPKFK